MRSDSELVGLVETLGHAVGFDSQGQVKLRRGQGLEVGRLIDPRVAVPAAASALDPHLQILARDVLCALEVHVLYEVRGAR